MDLSRVVVIGTSGSGKSIFAGRLAALLESPHVELDALYWGPDWTPASIDEFRSAVAETIGGDRWIVDGNYGQLRDILWSRATALVWLNYPFPLVFCRALRRTAGRIASRERIFSGNRESVRSALLSRDSILLWVIRSHWSRRAEYGRALRNGTYAHLEAYELRRPREAEAFLDKVVSPEEE